MKPTNLSSSARHIGLLSNPNSRRNRSKLAEVEAIVANHDSIHHRVTSSTADISAALKDFAELDVNVLAINGGDGTTARVFTELLEERPFTRLPAIILLPGGTTNMNVGDVGVRGGLLKAVQRMAAWAADNEQSARHAYRPILRVEGASDGRPVYGMFFGTGTIISGIEYCQKKIHTRGIRDEWAPGLVMLRTLWGIARKEPYFADPTATGITLDGNAAGDERPVIQLIITSLERLFLGLRPYWGQQTGELHCTWIEKPAKHLMRAFPTLVRGKPSRHVTEKNGYFSRNADEIRLLLDGTFTLDGEMHHATREHGALTITNGGTLEFLRFGDG